MDPQDPVQRVARAVIDLGICSAEQLAESVRAWEDRPLGEDTSDDDTELANFLGELHRKGLINSSQGRTLLQMLTGHGAAPLDPNLGRRFGEYVAETLIGEGGMGKVYRARHDSKPGEFVVKVFNATHDPAGSARFRREGEAMATLDHPNIVKVEGLGYEDQTPFIVLEYVNGPTLEQLMQERGKFSWQSATRAAKQIASALDAAHRRGIVHRDVKPANILVAPGGVLKVFDFGLAKWIEREKLTHAGEILGSPAYMAPEQWGDHEVDHRADLFALGVIYYQLLTAELPFQGRTPADFSWKVQAGKYEPVLSLASKTPAAVAALVAQLLERDRLHRPTSAESLLVELERVNKGQEPDLPRLQPPGDAEPYRLVGKGEFTIGSGASADFTVPNSTVAERHATLLRTPAGLLLRALDAPGGVSVNGQLVREIVLRDKDEVVLAEAPPLRYRIGNLGRGSTGRFAASDSDKYDLSQADTDHSTHPPQPVSGHVLAALVEVGHPRALVACLESLDSAGMLDRLAASRRNLLRVGVSSTLTEQAVDRARARSQERAWRTADALFSTTRENLGRALPQWLAFWYDQRHRFPPQLRAAGARACGRLRVTFGDDAEVVEASLSEGEQWVVGRAEDADITIRERSVSRNHLLLLRLNTRFAFRDLGSRFGTTVAGKRVEFGFLREDERLRLGRSKAEFISDPAADATGPPDSYVRIDPYTFDALVELRCPNVCSALIALLDDVGLCERASSELSTLVTSREVEAARLPEFFRQQRERALEALPEASGRHLGPDLATWLTWLHEVEDLPPQLAPQGWIL
ncbi:MAG: protein kinase [Planctomycetes bacterium]|nr:protein kinase [Planctomycetota bacterium]